MPPTAELVGRVGRLTGQHPPTEHGLTLTVRVLPGHGQGVQRVAACAMAADTVGLATHQGKVYAVHLSKQRYVCLDTLQPSAAPTSAAFMTRLSRRLFVGCADGTIQCYDVSTSSHLSQLPGHRTAVGSLSCKSDTEQLLSASADAVLLWDMATFRQRRMLGDAPYGSSQAAFSPAGNLLAAASAGAIVVWDAKQLRELCRLQTPLGQQQQRFTTSSISISPNEQWLLAGCKAPALLLLYNLQDRALQYGLQLPQEMFGVVQARFLPDSCSAAVLASDGCISFIDVHAGRCTGQLELTFPGCRALSFSTDPRANTMAVVCSDGLLRLYDLAIVRARQQQHTQRLQLQKLQEAQLLQLSPAAEVIAAADSGGFSVGRSKPHAATQAAAARGASVLTDVGNVELGSRGSRAKRPAATGRDGAAAAAVAGQLRVRQLGEPAAALNRRKLQEMLLAFGGFPARYRRLIWEQLLQLPHNSAAFSLLQDRGLHPAYQGLAQQMQAGSGGTTNTVANRLTACLSQLAHWCPLFGEAGFLSDFAFPFVKQFGPKAESAFEAVATLLLNWCKGWFELFPNPPLPLLRRFLLMLSKHDVQLGGHLQQLGVPFLERLWRLMSCGMSEVLPAADDWLVLWDHCLAATTGPAFFYAALGAYLITQRGHLLAAATEQELDRVFESRPAVDVRKVIKLSQQLHEQTPEYARLGASSLSPLPAGDSYPIFSDYPTGSVEHQRLERQRIQEAEEALIRRRQVVAELQQRSKQVAFEAAALTSQRQQLAAIDAQRRAALRAVEDSMATAGARLDDRAKEEKLRQIRLAEEAYQASLASLRAEWSAELAALKTDVEHKRRMAAATLKARQEDEDIKALEFQAQQRLWALQQEELAAAGSSALRDAATTQASALAAQLQRRAAEWQAEDEARKLKEQHELARKARLAAAAEQEAALQAAQGIMLAQELQTQEDLAKVEHQRHLRQLAEDEAKLTAQQLQLQAERQAVAAAATRQAVQGQAQQQTERFAQRQEARAGAVAAEYESLQQQLAQLHRAAAELGSSARLSEAQQQLGQMEATLEAADREHAARVASILGKLQARHAESLRASREASPTMPRYDSPAAATSTSMGTSLAAGSPAGQEPQLAASMEDVEARLATIRERRAALERLYGAQLDAEVQRMMTSDGPSQPQQAAGASPTRSEGLAGAAGGAVLPSLPTSEASAGSGSSSQVSQDVSGVSVDVSAELEHLLAEAEAEVQRELAAARVHFRGSGFGPHSSAKTPPMQLQYPSLQSSVGRGRGRSTTGSVAQGSHTVSTGVRGQAGEAVRAVSAARPAGTAGTAGTSSAGKLKPVLEEPPAQQRPGSAAAAAAAAQGGAQKPADSSSSSSSSPDKDGKGDGKKEKGAKQASGSAGAGEAGSSGHAAPAAAAAAAAAAAQLHPQDTQVAAAGSGSSSSHGSGVGHQGHAAQSMPAAAAAAAAMAAASQVSSPGSILSGHSTPSAGGVTSQRQSASVGAAAGGYLPVLVAAPGRSRASAETERFLTALSGGDHTPSSSGNTSSSSVSKPAGSLTFGLPSSSLHAADAPAVTPMLGQRTQARTASLRDSAAGLAPPAQGMHSASSSSVQASLHSSGRGRSASGQGAQQSGSEVEFLSPAAGGSTGGSIGLSARMLEPSGRVSSELRQSSSATSEELEQLLQQLSQYEEHLLEEAQAVGGLPPELTAQQQRQRGEVDTSLDSSLSWSQTLAGLTGLTNLNPPS